MRGYGGKCRGFKRSEPFLTRDLIGNIIMKRIFKIRVLFICLVSLIALCLLGVGYVFGVNAYVVGSTEDRVIDLHSVKELEDIDCIVVLGCKVQSDGELSHMLNDRMEVGVDVYFALEKEGRPAKLLVSGDHGTEEYNEVYAMKQFAIGQGIESSEIFMDHAGFSTYESIYRAKEIFGAERILIVTQEYHLYRALYIAEAMGIEAWGASADLRNYVGQAKYDAREILARNKDFLTAIFKPEPTYLGEKISLDGNGDVTNDY